MTTRHVRKQIIAILEANSLSWSVTQTGGMYLRFSSAGVSIELAPWGLQTLIQISADVLTDIAATGRLARREANRLNAESQFCRWVYYRESRTISVEYDLLGDHLQENELMTCLAALARAADFHDDNLRDVLGGRQAFDEQYSCRESHD